MNKHYLTFCMLVSFTLRASAALVIPGAHNGTDGALNISADTVIDLSQAVTGTYDQDNTANAGKGVYDATQWAVVFKYSSVTIAANTTVTFKNHPSRAPVIWLVSGNVDIEGTVSVNGQIGAAPPALAEPGPGGFRGGVAIYSTVGASAGFGPGGGTYQLNNGTTGSLTGTGNGGGFGASADPLVSAYGNPSLVPLLGGSGGSGAPYGNLSGGGGAGGGAILIVSAGSVTVNGAVQANGGASFNNYYQAGSGSGGGIRIIGDALIGSGTLNATSGGGTNATGSVGRTRLEVVTNTSTLQIVPDPSVVPLTEGSTALLFPPTGSPSVQVVSIGGVNAPVDPRAAFGSAGADVTLPSTTSTQVVIQTTNVEQASVVTVRLTPRSGADAQIIPATYSTTVSPGVLQWTATLPVNNGYSGVQVKVVRP